MRWLLQRSFPDIRRLLPRSLARMVRTEHALRVEGRHRNIPRSLPTMITLEQRFGSVESILIYLLRRGGTGHSGARNRRELLLPAGLVVNFGGGEGEVIASLKIRQTTRRVMRVLTRVLLRIRRI